MKSKVKLSTYCWIITLTTSAIIIGLALYRYSIREMNSFYLLSCIFLALIITCLIYAPRQIEVINNQILIKSFMRVQRICLRNVASVEPFMPTMGVKRVFGSGGFFGYYGIFHEGDVGRYIAYYGKSSDCFMIRMKNGDKYVLGCENPKAMVDYINSLLK